MRTLVVLFGLLAYLLAAVYADSTYIVALKKDGDAKQVEEAKSDIKSMGGKVLHEFKAGMKGFVVTLPDDQINAMNTKDYVDFVEADKEMHI